MFESSTPLASLLARRLAIRVLRALRVDEFAEKAGVDDFQGGADDDGHARRGHHLRSFSPGCS